MDTVIYYWCRRECIYIRRYIRRECSLYIFSIYRSYVHWKLTLVSFLLQTAKKKVMPSSGIDKVKCPLWRRVWPRTFFFFYLVCWMLSFDFSFSSTNFYNNRRTAGFLQTPLWPSPSSTDQTDQIRSDCVIVCQRSWFSFTVHNFMRDGERQPSRCYFRTQKTYPANLTTTSALR